MDRRTPGTLSRSSDIQTALRADTGFPFRCELSLAPLIAFWAHAAADPSPRGTLARMVGEEVQRAAPELLGTIDDAGVIERHRELVDVLMSAVFPPAAWEQEYIAALVPFQLRGFYATPAMRRLLIAEDGQLQGRVNLSEAMVGAMRLAYAQALVLGQLYGIAVDVDYPIICTVPDPETGLDRHFRMLFDWRFEDVVLDGELPPLDEDLRRRLQTNVLDPDLLRQAVPPERILIRGFTILRAVEVTDQEVLSALKRDLIDRESIVSSARFLGLQAKLQTLFRRPDLRLGLAALEGDRVFVLNYGSRHQHACIFADSCHLTTADFAGTVYARAVKSGQPVIIDDLRTLPERTPVEEELLGFGVRTMLVAPLYYQDRIIGTLDLTSPHPEDLNPTHLPKLHEVLPLFSMAVQRSMEELNARIQTQIKERFTAIHPVVEWRFRKAVLDALERPGDTGAAAELEPIVFDNVYPLYALSDIRGSSTQRALAIQADLLEQLRLARGVLQAALAARPLPALDEVRYRLDKHREHIERDLASGDEVGVAAFLRAEVEPLYERLQGFGASVRERVQAYQSALDPRKRAVYRQRRLFEESVTRLTEGIAAYLDLEEQAAQSMFPHYFEKQKTDGVDHQIYVGASLMEDGQFDRLYLKNLRLWQLMVVCGIAARAEELARQLPVPLETTHLIVVQNAPLAIGFRFDEKRFDVDGAYDVRYELVKKRIDKALVKGTAERLTRPGRIAIVYSQVAEAQEYRGYIEYLQHLGYLAADTDELELDELQGVHGLRALRVTVTLREAPGERPFALRALEPAAGRP
jgi:GAF domain-containing protein